MSGPPRYIYQRRGGPLVRWDSVNGRPPGQTRGADAKSLGDYIGTGDYVGTGLGSLGPDGNGPLTQQVASGRNTRPLPQPGAPEYLGSVPVTGSCGCQGSVGDDSSSGLSWPTLFVGAVIGWMAASYVGQHGMPFSRKK